VGPPEGFDEGGSEDIGHEKRGVSPPGQRTYEVSSEDVSLYSFRNTYVPCDTSMNKPTSSETILLLASLLPASVSTSKAIVAMI